MFTTSIEVFQPIAKQHGKRVEVGLATEPLLNSDGWYDIGANWREVQGTPGTTKIMYEAVHPTYMKYQGPQEC